MAEPIIAREVVETPRGPIVEREVGRDVIEPRVNYAGQTIDALNFSRVEVVAAKPIVICEGATISGAEVSRVVREMENLKNEVPSKYPKMLYHGKDTQVVADEGMEAIAAKDGFVPYDNFILAPPTLEGASRELTVMVTLHVHREFPKTLYHGAEARVVSDAKAESAAAKDGFGAYDHKAFTAQEEIAVRNENEAPVVTRSGEEVVTKSGEEVVARNARESQAFMAKGE